MSFSETVLKTWAENRLFSALLELTYRCNLDCFFCYNDVKLVGKALGTDDWTRLLDDLAAMGVFQLSLSGGEPLAHPDFLALGRRARALGFVVRVKSNGHALRGKLAERVRAEVDPFLVEVSLHGARPETHDRQTRVPGSFERLLGNLREMKALGLRVKLNATLTRWNEAEIDGMFDLAASLALPLQFDPEVTLRDDGDRTPLDVSASREGLLALYRIQKARAAASGGGEPAAATPPASIGRTAEEGLPGAGKHCGAGSSTVTVDPFGNVYPCVQWRVPIGNLHERSIREIWERPSEALARVRETTPRVKAMLAERFEGRGAFMSFCPGSAAAHAGDPLAVLPSAAARMDAAWQVHHEPAGLLPALPSRAVP